MIKEGETYEVYDGSGRHWGKVCFKWSHGNSIAGYLEALPDYDEVRPLFKKHEEWLSLSEITEEHKENSKIIATLGVLLVNPDTGEKKKADPVFVSEILHFTCSADV